MILLNKKKNILFIYPTQWHIRYSPAFKKSIESVFSNEKYIISYLIWDKEKIDYDVLSFDAIIMTHQYIWNEKEYNNKNIVYCPMFDIIRSYGKSYLERIYNNTKLICFSTPIRYLIPHLKCIDVRYMENPNIFVNKANFKNGRNLFYWNRIGLYDHNFIIKMCINLNINKLFLIDSNSENISIYHKINNNKNINVVLLKNKFVNNYEYLKSLDEVNINLCPRSCEGIGLSSLEQFSRGSVLISFNSYSLKDYIKHKKNGYLLNSPKILPSIDNNDYRIVTDDQDWKYISSLPIEKMGYNVLNDSQVLYDKWVLDKKKIEDFVLS